MRKHEKNHLLVVFVCLLILDSALGQKQQNQYLCSFQQSTRSTTTLLFGSWCAFDPNQPRFLTFRLVDRSLGVSGEGAVIRRETSPASISHIREDNPGHGKETKTFAQFCWWFSEYFQVKAKLTVNNLIIYIFV